MHSEQLSAIGDQPAAIQGELMKPVYLVMAMMGSVLLGGASASAAPVQWPSGSGGNDHWYDVVIAEGITWTDSRAAAQALGSGWDLATIGSAGEHAFVTSLLSTALPQRSHFWLGASDDELEGDWRWVDATAFAFTVWGAAEPNNAFGVEHYLAYDLRDGVWYFNDAPNLLGQQYGFARGFVAERAPVPAPEPVTMGLLLLGLAGAMRARRRD